MEGVNRMTICLYPQLAPSTAYNKGCRCERCCSYKRNRRKAWYSKNAKRENERNNQYNKNNRKERNKYKQQWRRQTPIRVIKENISCARFRAIQIGGLGCVPSLTPDEQLREYEIYETRYYLTKSTGIPHEVDHIIPISKQGLHHPDNLQVLTRTENRRKGANIL